MMLFSYRLTITVALAVLIACGPVMAQDRFEPGLIITSDGDTLRGQIRFDAATTPSEVWFRPSDDSEARRLSTESIAEFQSGERLYRRATPIIDASPMVTDGLPAFLYVLAEGPLMLLVSEEPPRPLFIVTEEGLVELRSTDQTRYDERRGHDVRMHYQAVLARHAGDCLSVSPRIDFLSFEEKRIVDFVRRYNACIDPENYPYRTHFGRKRLKFRLAGGLGAQSAQQAATAFGQRRIDYDMPARHSLYGGIGMEVQFPNDLRGRSFDVQVLFRQYDFSDERDEYIWGCRTDSAFQCPNWPEGEYRLHLEQTRLELADIEATVRFRHPISQRGMTPTIAVGMVFQVPVRREASASGTMSHRNFGPNPEFSYEPAEIDLYVGRTTLQSPVASLILSRGPVMLDLSVMSMRRFFPSIEDVEPERVGYALTRLTIGVML